MSTLVPPVASELTDLLEQSNSYLDFSNASKDLALSGCFPDPFGLFPAGDKCNPLEPEFGGYEPSVSELCAPQRRLSCDTINPDDIYPGCVFDDVTKFDDVTSRVPRHCDECCETRAIEAAIKFICETLREADCCELLHE